MLSLSRFLSTSALLCLMLPCVLAADICSYSSRSCFGASTCCTGVPANTCCYWTSNTFGWSVKFSNMPLNVSWFGSTYGERACRTSTSGVGSSGSSACSSVWDAPNYSNWYSAKWVVNARSGSVQPQAVEDAKASGPCRQADVVRYTAPSDGKEHWIKVEGDQLEHVEKLIEANDFKALEEFQHVEQK